MKKICLIVLIIFTVGLSVFAQEETAAGNDISIGIGAQDDETFKWGVNAGVEMNMNSGNHPQMSDLPAIAFGVHAGGEFNFNSMFSAGINLSVSFSDIFAFEAAGFFRWYFYKNIFAQADIGLWTGNKGEGIRFLGGASAGLRIPLPGNFYIEPYARFGYPFLAGGGVTAGYLFR